MTSDSGAPTEPNPRNWLTVERRNQIMGLIKSSRPLLIQAGLWRATLGYWVRWQASIEVKWPEGEDEKNLDELVEQWRKKNKEKESNTVALSDTILRSKLRVNPAVENWSKAQWGHRLDSLYLQKKNKLDKASCRILRVKEKRIASELYFRIKSGETTFASAASQFSEGEEKYSGGLIPLRPLQSMPFGLAPLLQQLETNKVCQPVRLGKGYCLVELLEFHPSRLDEKVERLLLAEQMQLWIDAVVDVLEAELQWEEARNP